MALSHLSDQQVVEEGGRGGEGMTEGGREGEIDVKDYIYTQCTCTHTFLMASSHHLLSKFQSSFCTSSRG